MSSAAWSRVMCSVEQAVENLESRLFFGRQYHILHEVNVTAMIYPGHLDSGLTLNVTG